MRALYKGVPKGHLDKNCPLQGLAWQHAYWTLRKFIKGVAGRLEVKMTNIVQENRLSEQAALRRRQNKEARKSQARLARGEGGDGAKGFPAGEGWVDSDPHRIRRNRGLPLWGVCPVTCRSAVTLTLTLP